MKSFFALLLFSAICFSSTAQRKISLADALRIGIENNFEVNRADLAITKEELTLRQSRFARFPDLSATVGYGINRGRSIDPFTNQYVNENFSFSGYGASAGVLLFNGFSLNHTIRSNELALQASEQELKQAKDNLSILIVQAYLNILKARDLLEQSKNQVQVSKKQLERLEVLDRENAITPTELYDLKGELAANRLLVADNEALLNSSKLTLSQLMNVPFDENMQPESIAPNGSEFNTHETADDIYRHALDNFAAIQGAELRVKSASAYVQAARGKMMPVLTLTGNLNTNYSSVATRSVLLQNKLVESGEYVTVDGTRYSVMRNQPEYALKKIDFAKQLQNNLFSNVNLNLTIPLFNASRTRTNLKMAQVTEKNYELEDKQAKMKLQQEIEEAFLNLRISKERKSILEDQVQAFAESFRSAEIRFDNGVITSVDYLIAKNNFDKAKLRLITARYDVLVKQKILNFYRGEAFQ